jgi:16S rRNA G966 N2-methylase RsmD
MSINHFILRSEVKSFIKAHENDDIPELILKGSPFENISVQSIAQQIKGLQVAKQKFPSLYKNENIIYPPKLNLEQSSSETTAKYKASLITKNESIIDLTGGMGIDTLAFSEKSDHVIYTEIDSQTFSYAEHNFKSFGKRIKTFCENGLHFLKRNNLRSDWIYIDPARRDQNYSKVFKLEDCQPNVLEQIDLFKSKSRKMMIKASPLLDINQSIELLPQIESLHIISVKNEVKELLILIDFNKKTPDPDVVAVNLESDQQDFVANNSDKKIDQQFSIPKRFLYEPNASVMKSGFFGKICQKFDLKALHPNSHLFTTDQNIEFPGRRFEIIKIIQPKKKLIHKYLEDKKANITTRNYPIKPDQIKKKYGIFDGGSLFVFFTTNLKNEKIVIISKKIND